MRAWIALAALALGTGSAAAADPLALREDFAAVPAAKPNGDIVFGSLVFYRENSPRGSVTPLEGGGIRLTVTPGAAPQDNIDAASYDRAELREGKAAYLKSGRDVWYRWSMRVPADFPSSDQRFVASQFKADFAAYDDASPLFALRIEDRKLFATLERSWDRAAQPALPVAADGKCPAGSLPGLVHDDDGVTPQVRIVFATDADGLPQRRIGQFDRCVDGVSLEQFRPLPALAGQWMTFTLHVKPGVQGLVELEADGQSIASARGHFADENPNAKQYFKFGPYRNLAAMPASLDFRAFRRSATREALGD